MNETSAQPDPTPAPSQSSPFDTPLPALRADLQISPQVYLGDPVYVVKDPVALQYIRVRPPERFVLSQLDGVNTAQQIADRAVRTFPEAGLDAEAVLRFVNQLSGGGWMQGRSLRHGAMMRKLRTTRDRRMRRARLMSFLFFRVPLLDPDRLLDGLYSFARPAMCPQVAALATAFMAISAIAAIIGLDRIGSLAFPVLGPANLLMLTGTFLIVKVIHEFGHGLAAKHRGLEVHEMGVFFMVFIPLLYVDTSDAWMVPRRRDRLWITAGGVFIEFVFAAAAVWVWLATEPGVLNQVAFNIMLAASVSTLLFNANPLLRYDGYYFLMDLVEIPNLRVKSTRYLGHLARRYLLRDPSSDAPSDAARRPILMVVYAITASVYRWFIVFGIILLIWHILDPIGLEAVGALLAALAVCTMVLLPMAKVVRFVWQTQTQNWRRFAMTACAAAGLGLIVVAAWYFPLEHTIERPAVVLASASHPFYAPTRGRVERVYVRSGQFLKAGDPIYRMHDEKFRDELARLELQLATAEVQRDQAAREMSPAQAEIAQQMIDRVGEQIAYVHTRLEDLTIRAPIDGQLSSDVRPRTMLGRSVDRGMALGKVIASGPRQLVLVVPEDDVPLIEAQQQVRARLWADPSFTLIGHVKRVGRRSIISLPHDALAATHGGEVDTVLTEGYKPTPSVPSVLAIVELDDVDLAARLSDGMTGRGKIVVGRSRFGDQQWRRLRQVVSLDWWL